MDDAPILAAACPFLCYLYPPLQGRVFSAGCLCREYGLGLCHLTELPVEVLYGIGGIDKPPCLIRVLEIGAEVVPVGAP